MGDHTAPGWWMFSCFRVSNPKTGPAGRRPARLAGPAHPTCTHTATPHTLLFRPPAHAWHPFSLRAAALGGDQLMAAAPAAALAGAAAAPAAPCAAPAPSPAVRLLKSVSSSPLARRSLLLLRIVVPAAALYGAAVIWFSAEGDTPLRRAAIAVAGLVEGAEAAAWLGLRGATGAAPLVPLCLVAIMIGVSAGVDASWWQAIVVMSIGLWLGVRWSPSCCGAAPTCCCACCPRAWRARACGGRRAQGGGGAGAGAGGEQDAPRARCCTFLPRALPALLLRLLAATSALLLLPALAAQSRALACLPPPAAVMGARVYEWDRALRAADEPPDTRSAPSRALLATPQVKMMGMDGGAATWRVRALATLHSLSLPLRQGAWRRTGCVCAGHHTTSAIAVAHTCVPAAVCARCRPQVTVAPAAPTFGLPQVPLFMPTCCPAAGYRYLLCRRVAPHDFTSNAGA